MAEYAKFAGTPFKDLEITRDSVAEVHEKIGVAAGIESYLSGVPIDDVCA